MAADFFEVKMKILRITIFYACFVLIAASPSFAKGWRGLEPLRSTRDDVHRLLGAPANPTDNYYYSSQDEDVIIHFSGKTCLESGADGYKVPFDTVDRILVVPKIERHIQDFALDDKYEKRVDVTWKNHVFYTNLENGEMIETNDGIVMSLAYNPATRYKHLRCFSTYEEWLEASSEVCGGLRKFDEYGDLPLEEEHERLDNYAIQLENSQTGVGYIIVYAEPGRAEEARAKAARAREYLVNKKGIKHWRVMAAADGRRRDLQTVELWTMYMGELGPMVETIALDEKE